MDASKYQNKAARTLIDGQTSRSQPTKSCWSGMQSAWLVRRERSRSWSRRVFPSSRYRRPFREKMVKELGDVMWYVAAMCTKLDMDLGVIMEVNIRKLEERYPDGFSSQDSKRRVDVQEEWLLRAAGWTQPRRRSRESTQPLQYLQNQASSDRLVPRRRRKRSVPHPSQWAEFRSHCEQRRRLGSRVCEPA